MLQRQLRLKIKGSNKNIKNKTAILLLLAVLIFSFYFLSSNIKNSFFSFSEPSQRFFWNSGAGFLGLNEALFFAKDLKEKSENLILENQRLLSEIISLKSVQRENEALRQALDLDIDASFKVSFAEIIGKNIGSDYLIINKGESHGIEKNMVVITSEKVLIGQIFEVYKNFSKVAMISEKSSVFEAEIIEKDASGVFRAGLLDLVSKDKNIETGDVVSTVASGGIYPSNLLVGRVKKIIKSDASAFQQLEIDLFFDLKILRHVFIIHE